MKLYSFQPAPNPRRTRIFIAEKGLEIPIEEVNLREREQERDTFLALNPAGLVPVLELDDGTCLSESIAICRYLEELYPEPPLLGSDPVERARVCAWNRRVEFEGMAAIAEALRNHSEFFVDRALPGPHPVAQIPELAKRGIARAGYFFDTLEKHLAESAHVVGDAFTMADISLLVTTDFAGWVKVDARAGRPNLARWYDSVSARPSASA